MNDMKRISLLLAVMWMVLSCKGTQEQPSTPVIDKEKLVKACQNLTGGGATATGGRSGSVYTVTTLSDEISPESGLPPAGSLRHAVKQSGVRLIIFQVAGTIHLTSPLTIREPNITIAGQSAPGDGICVADYPIVVSTNNVIIQFIRCRLGNASLEKDPNTDYDAVSVNNGKNIVLDHLSCSWSVDECVSCYGNENFTMQYCFVTEALRDAGHVKGAHGYGGIWGGKNASFHHNLLAHHDSRNPRFDHDYVDTKYAGPIDYVNNVVYNWGGNSTYGGEGTTKGAGGRHINMVNNYYKYGPSTSYKNRLVDPTVACKDYCGKSPGGTVQPGKFFLNGNYMYGDENVTADNWKGSTQSKSKAGTDTRWTEGMTLLANEQTAEEAFEAVLTKAGCSLHRDAVDTRIINDVRNGTGRLIDKPADVGGYPELDPGTLPQDSDGDGIPDEWESKYGMDPKKYSDSYQSTLVTGYTNLEVYLNEIVAHLY